MLSVQDIINFIDAWREINKIPDGADLTPDQLTRFASELQSKIGQMEFKAPVDGANVIPYNGSIGEFGAWQYAKGTSQSSGGTLCYISDIEAGKLLNSDAFYDGILEVVNYDTKLRDSLIGGTKVDGVRTQYGVGDVLAVNDFVSQKVMLTNAHGNVMTFTATSIADSVWTLTELPTLLKMPEVTSIDGIPKEELLRASDIWIKEYGLTEQQALQGLREIISIRSKANMSLIDVYLGDVLEVKPSGETTIVQKILGVDTSRLNGGSPIEVPSGSSVKMTLSEALGRMSEAELFKKYPELNKLDGTEISFRRQILETVRMMDESFGDGTNLKNLYPTLTEIQNRMKYLEVRGKVFKFAGVVGGAMLILDGINMLTDAVESYKAGDTEGGNKIIRDWLFETGGGLAGAAAFMEAIAPLTLALGAAGGPLGIAAGIIIELAAGAIGWSVGSEIGHAFSDLLGSLLDLFHTAEATISPLVIDLDGDGVETTLLESGTNFDHDGNGLAEMTAWAGRDDGLLVRDINGNGVIDSGSELFGNNTILTSGAKAANGFAALAELDENHDGKIDINDSAYSQLRVWKDADGDGVTDAGELVALDAAGIQSINTGYKTSTLVDAQGNEHKQVGTYTKTDGTTASIDDVWFKKDAMNTTPVVLIEETEAVAALPDIRGFGNVYSLHQAMLRDSSGRLQSLVEQFMTEPDAALRKELVTTIIYAWTGVEDMDPNGRTDSSWGNVIGDARKLEALEEFFAEGYTSFDTDGNPGQNAAEMLLDAFDQLSKSVYLQLMQSSQPIQELYRSISLVWDAESGRMKFDISVATSDLLNKISVSPAEGSALLAQFASNLYSIGLDNVMGFDAFRTDFLARGIEYVHIIDSAWKMGELGSDGIDTLTGTGANEAFWGMSGNDTMNGNGGDDSLYGDSGDDTINGGDGSDFLEGGLGNDKLNGGAGNDTYVFGRGAGADSINDNDTTAGNMDVLILKEGIIPGDVSLKRNGDNLEVIISGTTDKVVINSYFSGDRYMVEKIRFADGTEWDSSYVKAEVMKGTSGNDTLYGYAGADTLDGGTGNDSLSGGSGNDTYIFGRGYGVDTINEYDSTAGNMDVISFKEDILPSDVIIKRNGSNLELLINGTTDKIIVSSYFSSNNYVVEKIGFADGTEWDVNYIKAKAIEGSAVNDVIRDYSGDDVLDGLGGNDDLYGTYGNDTFIFGRGYGVDTIHEYDSTAGNTDVISLKEDVLPSDVTLKRNGSNLEVLINGTTDKLIVENYFSSNSYVVEKISFADGTEWGLNYILAKVMEGTDGSDVIYGYSGVDIINGLSGNDTLYGRDGNDILDGGTGNDSLNGEAGNDTYVFDRGYGVDTIHEYDSTAGNTDVISLREGILPSDVTIKRNGDNLEVLINGTTDKIVVDNCFYNNNYMVEKIRFADGTEWDANYIKAKVMEGSAVSDVIRDYSGADVLDGLGGNDTLYGTYGNDTFVFGRGYGVDTIHEYDTTAGNTDVISLKEDVLPSDVTLKRNGNNLEVIINGTTDKLIVDMFFYSSSYLVEKIRFADGTEWDVNYIKAKVMGATAGNDTIRDYAGDDIIDGLAGNDTLYGTYGNDTFVFGRGYGVDTVNEYDTTAGNTDVISLKEGILPSDVTIKRNGDNLEVLINGTTDKMIVNNYFYSTSYMVERIRFADGTEWDVNYIKAKVMEGSAVNDVIRDYSGADVLDGLGGNDSLYGTYGNDTFVFGRGYGVDTVNEYDNTAGNTDVISLKEGILPSDVTIKRNGDNLEVLINGTTDKMIVNNYFYSTSYMVERIRFTDGTEWDVNYIKAKVMEGSAGSDVIRDYSGADVLDGLGGNDTLYGTYGNDTFVFGRGYGVDTVNEYDTTAGNTDVISLKEDVLPSDVTLKRNGSNLEILINGTTDKMIVNNYFYSTSYMVERIRFADGTEWDVNYIKAKVMEGTVGNDVIRDYSGADVLDGLGGNDTLYGTYGNDTFVFGRGYGVDTVNDYDTTAGNTDVISLKEDVLPSDVTLKRNGNNLEILINGTTDKMVVDMFFYSNSYVVEKIRFADGTEWGLNYILAKVMEGTAAGETLYGYSSDDIIDGREGNDTIYGYAGADTINGGVGNDTLYGGNGNDVLDGGIGTDTLRGEAGNDTYNFSSTYGQDTIYDYDTTGGNKDTVNFGDDLLQLIFLRDGSNLKISVNGTTDTLTINSWYTGNAYHVEEFKATDGSVLLNTQVEQLIQAMATFSQENGISWDQAIDERPQDVQNILSQFWVHQ